MLNNIITNYTQEHPYHRRSKQAEIKKEARDINDAQQHP